MNNFQEIKKSWKTVESAKKLRLLCAKPNEKEHLSAWFFRLFSIYLTRICLVLGINSNQVTLLSFLSGLVGGIFFVGGHFLIGSLCFLLFYMFDNVDGEIARYKKTSSLFGNWLDIVVGHILYPYFFLSLGLGLFLNTNGWLFLFWGAVGAIAKLLERSVPKPEIPGAPQVDYSKKVVERGWRTWIGHIVKYPIMLPLAILASLFDKMNWFLTFIALYSLTFAFGKFYLAGLRQYQAEKNN